MLLEVDGEQLHLTVFEDVLKRVFEENIDTCTETELAEFLMLENVSLSYSSELSGKSYIHQLCEQLFGKL